MSLKEYIYSPHYDFYINKARRTAGYDMKTFHLHKKYEIYYLLEGTRRYFIEDSVYPVSAGNVVIIGKDEVHKTAAADNAAHTRYVLNFNPEYLGPSGDCGCDLLSLFDRGVKVLTVSMKLQGLFESIFQRLYDLNGNDAPEAGALRKTLLTELLIYLKGCVADQLERHAGSEKLSNKTVDRITGYLSANYTSALSLTEIAARFYISPYYLSHLFKKTTNLSIVEFINSVRIRAAKNYLERTSLSVAQIALKTGFNTASHFSRVFKLGTGLSPNQYRKFYHKPEESG